MSRDCVHGSLARSCEVCDLRAEVVRLTDGIRARHRPITVEVEKYHDDDHFPGELEGDCPDGGGCPGHLMESQTCGECGYLEDPDFEVAYRPWPCPTVALLDVAGDDPEPVPYRALEGSEGGEDAQ